MQLFQSTSARRRSIVVGCAVAYGLFCGLATNARAADKPYVVLGASDGFALDQARVALEVIDASGQVVKSFGPSDVYNTMLLDTGASGILVVSQAAKDLQDNGIQNVAVYNEQGVAGFTPTNVSAPYRVDFADSSGVRNTLNNVRILSTPDLDFGGFSGIVGMPAMVGRNTTMDFTVWSGNIDLSNLFVATTFSAAPTVPAAHGYDVPLTLVDFPLTGQVNPGDPLPTSAPLPFLPVSLEQQVFNGSAGQVQTYNGQFLLDTGAQISILSTATALALGLDRDGDGNFTNEEVAELPVGGIGGEVTIPILNLDKLSLHTASGIDLQWTGLSVGIQDIDPAIPGVFGMELITSGWFNKVFGGAPDDGYLEKLQLDFRQAANHQGTLKLEINPALDTIVSTVPFHNPAMAQDVNHNGQIAPQDALILINDINSKGTRVLTSTPGPVPQYYLDVSGDNAVNAQDLLIIINYLNSPHTSSVTSLSTFAAGSRFDAGPVLGPSAFGAVPEPSSLALAGLGLFMLPLAAWKARRQSRR